MSLWTIFLVGLGGVFSVGLALLLLMMLVITVYVLTR